MFQTPEIRYTAFSNFLSGVTLYARLSEPRDRASSFFDLRSDCFAGVYTESGLTELLGDVGLLPAWREQGHKKIWLKTTSPYEDCHILSVFSEVNGVAELLLHAVVWLEYAHFDSVGLTLPTLCVEHLRLQNPRAHFDRQALPGQDFPSSGLYYQTQAIARHVGLKTGALCVTEVPQYFHTAYLFSKKFIFVDNEMCGIFNKVCKDLLPERHSFFEVAQVSRAFEENRVRSDGEPWSWTTEMQAMSLDKDVSFGRNALECPCRFSIIC